MTVDALGAFGLEKMDEAEIDAFLSARSVGVLGLQGEQAPVLRPMSYGYDEQVYLRFVVGADSQKRPTADGVAASFLVYTAESAFNWRSVVLSGTLEGVPTDEHERVAAAVDIAWRPELLERAGADLETELYALAATERAGVKHPGLPPGLDAASE